MNHGAARQPQAGPALFGELLVSACCPTLAAPSISAAVRFAFVLGLTAGLALPKVAAAQTNTARLEVTGAEADCADAESLRVAVEQRLGRTAIDAQAKLVVRVDFQARKPSGWLARITLVDDIGRRLGQRELVTNAARCNDLDSSLALVTALLVDAPPEPPAEEPSQPEPVEPKPTRLLEPQEPPPPLRAPPPPPEPWRFMVGLNALAAYGHTPEISPGARFDFDVQPPRLIWFKLEVRLDLPQTVEDEQTGAGARLRYSSVALALCPWVGERSPAPWFCLGQELSWIQASGLNLDVSRERTRFSPVIFARLGLALKLLGPLWFRVGLTGGVPLVRDRYIFSGSDQETHELFRTQPIIATGELGIAAAFR
jgi:hypothetical protein